jgi:hypothetical protein
MIIEITSKVEIISREIWKETKTVYLFGIRIFAFENAYEID